MLSHFYLNALDVGECSRTFMVIKRECSLTFATLVYMVLRLISGYIAVRIRSSNLRIPCLFPLRASILSGIFARLRKGGVGRHKNVKVPRITFSIDWIWVNVTVVLIFGQDPKTKCNVHITYLHHEVPSSLLFKLRKRNRFQWKPLSYF